LNIKVKGKGHVGFLWAFVCVIMLEPVGLDSRNDAQAMARRQYLALNKAWRSCFLLALGRWSYITGLSIPQQIEISHTQKAVFWHLCLCLALCWKQPTWLSLCCWSITAAGICVSL